MADDESRIRRKDQEQDGRRRTDRRSEAGFDRWIVDQLRKLYDEVLEEDVPEDLVKIVRGFDVGQEGGADGDRERSGAEEPLRGRRSRRPRG